MAQPEVIVPLVVGRYALHEKIAAGGMANVYLGRLAGAVGFMRTVAIKRLHAHFASDPEFAAMFLDEARLAARIRHPNVIPTLDVVASKGELFLVMEYVEGESLSQLLRPMMGTDKRIPVPVSVAIMSGVLQGLHAAHEAKNDHGEPLGIVHRDVSPQNVIVGTDGVPRVLDFGVAKAVGKLHSTRQGEIKGKLRYMAPEQLLGHSELDRLTDVFAASIVLWEALAGQSLFGGESDGQIVRKVIDQPIQPPSLFNPEVPAVLNDVVLRGLERDKTRRFQTAAEMAGALEDAVPAATARKVGEWVKAAAGERISERAAKVMAVEQFTPTAQRRAMQLESLRSEPPLSEGAAMRPALAPPTAGSAIPVTDGTLRMTSGEVERPSFAGRTSSATPPSSPAAEPADLSTEELAASGLAPRRSTSLLVVLGVLGVALLAAGAVVAFGGNNNKRQDKPVAATASAPAATSARTEPAASAAASPAQSQEPAASAASSSVVTAQGAATGTWPATAPVKKAATPPPAGRPAAAPTKPAGSGSIYSRD